MVKGFHCKLIPGITLIIFYFCFLFSGAHGLLLFLNTFFAKIFFIV